MENNKTQILHICNTYPEDEYGDVTQCVISIKQGDNIVVLQEEELLELANVMHARFVAI